MRIIVNEKTIQRNKRIGSTATIVAVALFGVGIFFTWTVKDQQVIEQYLWVMYGTLALGFIAAQVGISLGTRFGRAPRMDERLSAALKGLTKEYALYHYTGPVSHLLVGPAGVWAIQTYHQRGIIVYEKNRWKQRGGGALLAYLKLFAQEGLGRPELDVENDLDAVKKWLKKTMGENVPPINAALVFLDPRAELQADNAPYPTLRPNGLKEVIRRAAKTNPLPEAVYQQIQSLLPQE